MDLDLGHCQLEAEALAGNDPREGATFASLTEQLDKLTDIHAPGEPDWALVSDLCQRYLRKEAKDLAVACWMTAAWFRLHGTPGLVAGVSVLNDLHQTHWEDMLPSRPRARRNLLSWLMEWLGKAFDTLDADSLQPLEPAAHESLQDAWRALDAFLQEHDGDGPSLLPMATRLRNLPVVEPEAPPAPGGAESGQATGGAVTAAPSSIAGSAIPAAPGSPAANHSVATSPGPSAATTAAIAAASVVPAVDAASIHTAQALETAVEKHLDALRPLLDLGVANHPTEPWVYLLTRTHAWGLIQQIPPSSGSVTRIPAPPQPEQDILERLLGAAAPDPAAILQFAESRLPVYRFWLDLNHHSWQALGRIPDGAAAAATVAEETARLLTRLPGVADLAFANQQPFASPATREWLDGLRATTPHPAAAAGSAAFEAPASPSDTLTLATAVAAASAQAAAAHSLLATALERLENTAQQLRHRVAPASTNPVNQV